MGDNMSTFSMTDIMTKVGRNLETEDAKLEVTPILTPVLLLIF